VTQGSKLSGLLGSPGTSEIAQLYGKNQAAEFGFRRFDPVVCYHFLCVITNIAGTTRDQSLKLSFLVGFGHGVQ
jgi:hypothetical protein